MNQVLVDLPEREQANAFAIWMEDKGFELFKTYYAEMMPEYPQPNNSEVEFSEDGKGRFKHLVTIE